MYQNSIKEKFNLKFYKISDKILFKDKLWRSKSEKRFLQGSTTWSNFIITLKNILRYKNFAEPKKKFWIFFTAVKVLLRLFYPFEDSRKFKELTNSTKLLWKLRNFVFQKFRDVVKNYFKKFSYKNLKSNLIRKKISKIPPINLIHQKTIFQPFSSLSKNWDCKKAERRVLLEMKNGFICKVTLKGLRCFLHNFLVVPGVGVCGSVQHKHTQNRIQFERKANFLCNIICVYEKK